MGHNNFSLLFDLCVVFALLSLTFSYCCQFFVTCLSVTVKPHSLRQKTKPELEKQLDELKTELAQVRGKVYCGGEIESLWTSFISSKLFSVLG